MEPVAEDPLHYMAEETKPEWHWNFSEEDVRIEREEGLARIETARGHLRAQETVVRNINSKLQEQDSAPTYAPSSLQAFMLGIMQGGSGAGSRAGSASQALSYGSSIASPEQQRSALVVADNIIRRQERVLESDRLRREVLEREEQSRERTMAELEAADTRCARKQELILQEQRRKAFAAQQRRSEQQKVARELQRDQIKMREAYYAKTSPSRPSRRQQAERPQTSLSASSAIPQYSSEPNLEEETSFDQDILKHTQRSHSMYAGTMDRWNKFVNENERRTEAYWRKMLGGSNLDRGGDRRKGRGRRGISSGGAGGYSTPSKRATDGRKACLSEGAASGLVEGDEFLTREDLRKSSKRIPVSVSAEGSPRDYSPWASPTNDQRSASKRPLKHSSTTQALPTMSLGSRETSPAQISAAKSMGCSSPAGFYKPPQELRDARREGVVKRMSLPALPSLSLRDTTKRATRIEVVETELQRLQEKKEHQAKENKKEMEQRLARIAKERTDKIQQRSKLWEERYNQAAKRKSVSLAAYEAELLRKHEENAQKRAGSANRQRGNEDRGGGGELIDKVTLARNVQKAARLFKEKTAEHAKRQIAEKEASAMQNYQARLGGLSDQDRREKHVEQTRLAAERKWQLESEFRSKAQGEIAKKAAKSADVIGHQSRRPLERQRSRLRAKGARSSFDSPPARHSPPLVPTEFPIDFDPAELDLLQEQRDSLSSAGSDDAEDKTAFLRELREKSNGWLRDMRSPKKEKDVTPWKPF